MNIFGTIVSGIGILLGVFMLLSVLAFAGCFVFGIGYLFGLLLTGSAFVGCLFGAVSICLAAALLTA